MRNFFKILISLIVVFSFNFSAYSQESYERKVEIEGNKYTIPDARKKAFELIQQEDYKRALVFYQRVGPWTNEDDDANRAYCLYMLKNYLEAISMYSSLSEQSKNPKLIDYSKKMIKLIDHEMKQGKLVEALKESFDDCKKKRCKWRAYYTNSKTEILKEQYKRR